MWDHACLVIIWGSAPTPANFLERKFDQRTLLTNFLVQICLHGYSQRHLYNPCGSLNHSVICYLFLFFIIQAIRAFSSSCTIPENSLFFRVFSGLKCYIFVKRHIKKTPLDFSLFSPILLFSITA